jgi:hypothetical protein
MADKKITDLAPITTVQAGTLFVVVDTPGGVPTDKNMTVGQLQSAIVPPLPLAVASGGTGVATLAAHSVLVGEGTAVAAIAPGTAGQYLQSQGAAADPIYATIPVLPAVPYTVPMGGTGMTALAAHSLLVGEGTIPVAQVAPGTAGQVLTSQGAAADPVFQAAPVPPVPFSVANGGTGAASLAAHSLLVGEGTTPVALIAPGTAGQILTSQGPSLDPSFQTSSSVVPPIPFSVPNGGTGVATLAAHNVLVGEGTANVVVIAPGAAGQVLTSTGASTDPAFQANVPSYDEGNWTPTVSGDGGGSGQTYAVQYGHYIKVGKCVTVWFNIGLSAKGTITGNVIVSGLPFVVNVYAIGAMNWVSTATNWTTIISLTGSGASLFYVRGAPTAATNSNNVNLTTADLLNNTSFYGTVSYFTP